MSIEDDVRDALRARADLVDQEATWSRVEPSIGETAISLRRRIAAGLVAAAVALGGFGLVVVTLRPDPVAVKIRRQGWAEYKSGWTQLPTAPSGLPGRAWAWTGSELIAWGGSEEGAPSRPSAAGARFDPATGVWRSIPEAPESRSDAQAVWTGRQVLFWGGWDGRAHRMDGLAFDPERDEWATIPRAPLDTDQVAVTVWTGSELIVWGGGRPDSIQGRKGAAYDPVNNSWRELPIAPLGLNLADGVWTGDEMYVFGSLLDGRNYASTPTAVGARYDPLSDRWFELEPSALSPQATALGFIDGRLLAYDYVVRSQTYDLARERWSEPIRMPLRAGECYPDLTGVQGIAFAFYCGQAAIYKHELGWSRVTGGMLDEMYEVGGNSYQLYRFATIVPVGEGIVFAAEGITESDTGEVCYGCLGAPRVLWFWRP